MGEGAKQPPKHHNFPLQACAESAYNRNGKGFWVMPALCQLRRLQPSGAFSLLCLLPDKLNLPPKAILTTGRHRFLQTSRRIPEIAAGCGALGMKSRV
jgi:hypothetical protein